MLLARAVPASRRLAVGISRRCPRSFSSGPRALPTTVSKLVAGAAAVGISTAGGAVFVAYCESSSESTGFSLPKFFEDFFGKKDGEKTEVPEVAKEDEGENEEEDDAAFVQMIAELPLISLDEVKKHKSEDDIWVTYEGVVYDVTSFVQHHPGGKELLLTAAGLDLGHFFNNYTVHLQDKKSKARGYLDGMAIGRLTPEDATQARETSTPETHIEGRMSVLGKARNGMLLVMASLPLWIGVRFVVQVVGYFVPPLGHWLATWLPVSVPGFAGARPIPASTVNGTKARVAVIGGGIAGSGAAYSLTESGYEVTLYEARKTLCGNARQWEWDVDGKTATTCVSVTAWPAILYKNYVALLEKIDVKTTQMPLSWFLYSTVPGLEGFLWAADPSAPEGSLRRRFAEDFRRYDFVQRFVRRVTNFYTLEWFGGEISMYTPQTGLGVLNPLNVIPLHTICRMVGISQEWWDIVFTPHYTASFLSDKLDNMCAVTAPLIEVNIPLNPTPENSKDRILTTCETWSDAGAGIREVFAKMTAKATVHTNTRVLDVKVNADGTKTVTDEYDRSIVVDKVVFACQCTAVQNIHKGHNWMEDTMLAVPEYADDWHPGTGHMHAIMHNDGELIAAEHRADVLANGSNYVEISRDSDGKLNIENTYNFCVQSPGIKWLQDIPAAQRPPLLISHALTEGKVINPDKIVGTGNHARAHPLYSGWNIMTMLSLRLAQGRNGIYYCANWTTPGNTHDMSLLSGFVAAHAIGAAYPFPHLPEALKDFERLRSLMGM